jgi:glutaredoxin 2
VRADVRVGSRLRENSDGQLPVKSGGHRLLVPALVLDDGALLTEGAAIVQYIADRAPTKNLAPPNGTIDRTRLEPVEGTQPGQLLKSNQRINM